MEANQVGRTTALPAAAQNPAIPFMVPLVPVLQVPELAFSQALLPETTPLVGRFRQPVLLQTQGAAALPARGSTVQNQAPTTGQHGQKENTGRNKTRNQVAAERWTPGAGFPGRILAEGSHSGSQSGITGRKSQGLLRFSRLRGPRDEQVNVAAWQAGTGVAKVVDRVWSWLQLTSNTQRLRRSRPPRPVEGHLRFGRPGPYDQRP